MLQQLATKGKDSFIARTSCRVSYTMNVASRSLHSVAPRVWFWRDTPARQGPPQQKFRTLSRQPVRPLWIVMAAILLCPWAFAQESTPKAKSPQDTAPQEKEPHLLLIIPMGDVAGQQHEPPLSSKGKLRLFVRDTRDPFILLPPLAATGFSAALLDNAGFGWGGAGFAKHFGAALADETSNRLLGTWVFPSLLHQDSRYYPRGSGGFRKRLGYALSRVAITRSDAAAEQVNYSCILAALVSASVSNSYYPEGHTGVRHTFSTAGINLGITASFNVLREFLPELGRLTSRHKVKGSAAPQDR